MKCHLIGLLAFGIVLGASTFLSAAEPSVGELTRELTGEKPLAARTPDQLQAACAQVLDALMPDLAADDPGRRASAQGTIEKITFHVGRPGGETERLACSKAIAARLASEAGTLARVWLLRQLERIAHAEAVPTIGKCLADKDPVIRESARRTLQENPSQEANAALREAMGSADTPAWRAALVHALTQRRDPANLGVLASEAAAENDAVRAAAVVGPAELGHKGAIAPITAAMAQGSPAARAVAVDSLFRLAETMCARGDKAAALEIYRKMVLAEGHIRSAALIGIGRTGGEGDLPVLLEALVHPDAKVRGACVEALCLLQGENVTASIAEKAKTADCKIKPSLLQALAGRADKNSVPLFMAAAEDADESVRAPALAGLRVVGGAAAVPLLVKAAVTAGKSQETARQTLQALPGADVDNALVDAIAQQDPKVRTEVIRMVALRHVVAAAPSLLKAAEDPDASVRNESLRALGEVAASSALPGVVAVLLKTDDAATRNEAANALVNIASRDRDFDRRADPILKAIAASNGPAKFALLGAVGRIGGRNALQAVRALVKDKDEKVRDAAIRALAEWPDATAADDLLAVATTAVGEIHQVLALRGYIRVCSIRADRPATDTARMLIVGLKTARRPDEKRQALGGLSQVPHILALEAVAPCLGDDALKEEAAVAVVYIGHHIGHEHPVAVKAAVEKAIAITKNEGIKQFANDVLGRVEERLKETKRK